MQALVIDAFSYCQLQEQRNGSIAITDLPRLSEEVARPTGSLAWSLNGSIDALGNPQLIVKVSGTVELMCQRCLTPFSFDIDSESVLILAKNEASADEIDALLDDDEIDVVVGSKTFNVTELIEDEALLAIPQSPKHAVCPDAVDSTEAAVDFETSAETSKKVSPFAVLKKINGRT